MYSEWASLQQSIQNDKSNSSVLHTFPESVGRDVACSVVKHLASSLSVSINNSEPSNLATDKEVKWTMEVICFGLSLPLSEGTYDAIRDCVNVYCEWLSSLLSPKVGVPRPVVEDPNPYAQDMLHHLYNLFVPREDAGVDLVKRQTVQCHRVLRTVKGVASQSTQLARETWETLLQFLLAITDTLLAPPTIKDGLGDQLCERVLSELFELWLLACERSFPSPSLWKTFRDMCANWRHHEALVIQWHKVNVVLTARVIRFMQGPEFPEFFVSEEDSAILPSTMDNDCIAQTWFRFLHILNNPVDLCHPEIISQTPKFLHMALTSDSRVDPSQHESLWSLPHIFFKAMKGTSVLVDAFLGVAQQEKEVDSFHMGPPGNRHSMPPLGGSSTPPGNRKGVKAFNVSAQHASMKAFSKTGGNTRPVAPSTAMAGVYGMVTLESRLPLAPSRPNCNSILHMFGAWLFEAALANVKLHPNHSGAESIDGHLHMDGLGDNYEAGRAEALGALCRIICAKKTKEDIQALYLSRFYLTMYYGLATDSNLSGQVLANILFNSCDLLRIDLVGVQILVPHILSSLELVLHDLAPNFKVEKPWWKCLPLTQTGIQASLDERSHEQIPPVELRKASIHLLLSMLCLPLHFKALHIKPIIRTLEAEDGISFMSLRLRLVELLLRALTIETDPANTQMLLGALLVSVQDLAMCEQAEQTTVQELNDVDADLPNVTVPEAVDGKGVPSGGSPRGTDTVNSSEPAPAVPPATTAPAAAPVAPGYQRQTSQPKDYDTSHGLFGHAVSLVATRLMASWKLDLSTALAAMEVLSGLAKVHLNMPSALMCKRTVKWICDFIVYQCSRPPPSHSRDLHSMIVAAFQCLTLWLVEHQYLMQDKECLHVVLEVVELGISGTKSQPKLSESSMIQKFEKDTKTVSFKNRASDPPKLKAEKQLMPASMRVRDAAEAVLTTIIDQVGSFPPPCGPESLCSLLDEDSLLRYCKGGGLPEQGVHFRYFVLENTTILGLLEQPLANDQDPLPTVTALIRGPFGRHAWTMQLRHLPRHHKTASKAHLSDPGRPQPQNNVGVHHEIHNRFFPEMVDKIPLTEADKSIPPLDSIASEKVAQDIEKLKGLIDMQTQFEKGVSFREKQNRQKSSYPNPETDCSQPSICHEFQTARLFLSHYGFLSLEALKEPRNSTLPPSLVMLDAGVEGFFSHLEALDKVPCRTSDTAFVFYVKAGQRHAQDIVNNVSHESNVQPVFLEFLRSLGWPVDVKKHAGWTGHTSTSWRIIETEDEEDVQYPTGTGGRLYDGQQQVLYWADVCSEVAFIVPSIATYVPRTDALADPSLEKNSSATSDTTSLKSVSSISDVAPVKPKSLSLDLPEARANLERSETVDSPRTPDAGLPKSRKFGRQTNTSSRVDTKVFVVWLENFEDHANFPLGDMLLSTTTGLESASSTASINKPTEKDVFVIYIHALRSGLYRIHMQGQTGRTTMAIPLVDGMVVSRRTLGTLVRQTAINICWRKRLESESHQPPHVRRKLKIQEIVNKYKSKMTEPEFYTALFRELGSEQNDH